MCWKIGIILSVLMSGWTAFATVRDWTALSDSEKIQMTEQSLNRLKSNPDQNSSAIWSHEQLLKRLHFDMRVGVSENLFREAALSRQQKDQNDLKRDAATLNARNSVSDSDLGGGGRSPGAVKNFEEAWRPKTPEDRLRSANRQIRANDSLSSPRMSMPASGLINTSSTGQNSSDRLRQNLSAERDLHENIMKKRNSLELLPSNSPFAEQYKNDLRRLQTDRINRSF